MPSDPVVFERPKNQRSSGARRRWKWVLLIVGGSGLALIVAYGFYIVSLSKIILPAGSLGRSVDPLLMATADDPSFGNVAARVVVVEFSDFECPFCSQVQPVVKELHRRYSDQVYFVYRDFPLTQIHSQALLAAMAGQCAHEQGKFWEMHDKLFANQDRLALENIKKYAVEIGLNSLQFNGCVDTGKYLSEIEQDIVDGSSIGIEATPTFIINGVKFPGVIPLTTFEKIITAEYGTP